MMYKYLLSTLDEENRAVNPSKKITPETYSEVVDEDIRQAIRLMNSTAISTCFIDAKGVRLDKQ